MKFRGVLLKKLDNQYDRDFTYIDPAGVEFDPEEVYLVSQNFDYAMPPAGWGKVSRAEDGSLVVEGELSDFFGGQRALAIGAISDKFHRSEYGTTVVDHARLTDMALTERHADTTQPWIEVEPA
jgi:hypothetical protein